VSMPPPPGHGYQPAGSYGTPQPRPAELFERFVARFIDGLLVGIVSGFVFGGLIAGIFITSGTSGAVEFVVRAILTVLGLAVSLGYYAYFETTSGQTLGKMVMKLKVVGPSGQKVTLDQSLRRNAFYALSLLAIVPLPGFGFLANLAVLAAWIFIAVTINNDKPLHQGWHDKFAQETYVMKLG